MIKITYKLILLLSLLAMTVTSFAASEAEYGKVSKAWTLHADGSQEYRSSMELTPVSYTHLDVYKRQTVRYAQLYTVPETVEVCCNRGTSGIEGSLSTAIGYASASQKLNFIVIGDLSFFYDMNALWNGNLHNNLRILLLRCV